MLVHLLTNTFERFLSGRWSVFWPSYLCFVLKLVNEVRCRAHLSFHVLAFGLCSCTAFTYSGWRKCWSLPSGTDFFPLLSQMDSKCRHIRDVQHPLFFCIFLMMVFDIYFPENTGVLFRFYLALFPVRFLLTLSYPSFILLHIRDQYLIFITYVSVNSSCCSCSHGQLR